MRSSFEYDIVIQGAGSSGCVAALLAHQCGLKVAIIDKSEKGMFRGNAHYLNAYSLELLYQCGLDMDRLARLATPESYAFSMAYGLSLNNIIYTLNLLDDPSVSSQYQSIGRFGAAMNIPFSQVYQELIELIESCQIPILWQSEIAAVDEVNHSISVTTRDKKLKHTITTHYLIGADGVQSGVRKLLFPPPQINTHDYFINVEIMSDLSTIISEPAMLTWIINPSFPSCFVMHQINGHQNIQIPVFIKKNLSYAHDKQWVERYISETLGDDNVNYTLVRSQPWVVTTHCMGVMRKDWVFLLGDSAHTLTPAGGLGLNTALGDAANLIWKLSSSLKSGSSKNMLDSYQLERAPINSDAVNQSLRNFNDFKSITKSFFLPSSLSIPWKSTLSYLSPNPKKYVENSLANTYLSSMKFLLRSKNIKKVFIKNLKQRLMKTKLHFNGIGSHLGYRIDSDLIIGSTIDNNYSIDHYQPSFDPGSLCLLSNTQITDQSKSLLDIFKYGYWVALLSHEDKDLELLIKTKASIRYFICKSDLLLNAYHCNNCSCVIIRPDFFVAYAGDSRNNPQLLSLLKSID